MHDCRPLPLKALQNTFETCQKTHTKASRYGSQEMEDVPATQDSGPLALVPLEHPMSEEDNETSDEHCEEANTPYPLAELLEQIWQLIDQITYLKSTTHRSTPTTELTQLTDKLQHVTMMLKLHSALQSSEKPVHKPMQAYTDAQCTTQRESNLTTTMLQDIPHLMGRTPQS